MFRIVKEKKSLFQLNQGQEGSEAAQCNHPDWYSLVPCSVITANVAGSPLKLNERLKLQAFSPFRDNVLFMFMWNYDTFFHDKLQFYLYTTIF